MRRALVLVIALLGTWVLMAPVASAESATNWLCRPGAPFDPCGGGTQAPVDCFYVYPTASLQPTLTANNAVTPEIAATAALQAGPFGSACNVWAPVYRQLTLTGLFTQEPGQARDDALASAFVDVESAWDDYMTHHNDGRGVVLVGHSQGSRMLTELLRGMNSDERAQLVSAVVPGIRITQADLPGVDACTDASQNDCVVTYSAFSRTPPPDSRYGGEGVLCTNPASLGANDRAALRGPIPGFTSQCDADNVLMIDGPGASALPALPNETWGLHLLDLTIPQQTLVDLVRTQSAAYLSR